MSLAETAPSRAARMFSSMNCCVLKALLCVRFARCGERFESGLERLFSSIEEARNTCVLGLPRTVLRSARLVFSTISSLSSLAGGGGLKKRKLSIFLGFSGRRFFVGETTNWLVCSDEKKSGKNKTKKYSHEYYTAANCCIGSKLEM